jgi:L-fucose mutarotase/ribose pyranase (RbsD/FucU family)
MLDTSIHSLSALFAQLGLPNGPKEIENFIQRHHPLPQAEPLANAAFWNEAQAAFLRDAIVNDSDWAEIVDELNVLLRD